MTATPTRWPPALRTRVPADLAPPTKTPTPPGSRVDVFLRAGLVVAAIGFIACYAAVAITRFRAPYQLEWLEGGVLLHVRRVLNGQPLYGAPSLQFTPFLYTPLYYYVSAGLAWLIGLHLSTLRIVSILSSVAALGVVYRMVWLETRNRWAAIIAAGLLAACFRLAGAWLDLARVDSLFLALLLVGLLCVRQTSTRRGALVAGVVLAAAFLTKQSAAVPMVVVIPFLWRRGRGLAVVYGATLGVILGGTTLWFNHATGGWYSQYVLRLAGQHTVATNEYLDFFTHDLLRPLSVVLVVAALGLLASRRGERAWFWIPAVGALLFASYTARLHTGGYDNVLLPGYAGVAMATGLGVHALTRLGMRDRHRGWSRLLLAGVLITFLSLVYLPWRQIPSAATTRAGNRLVTALGRLPQPVYLPSQSWLLDLARPGTPTTSQSAAFEDVLRGHLRGSNHWLARDLRTAIGEQRFASVVVDSPAVYSYLPKNFNTAYCRAYTLPHADQLEPVTGTRAAPSAVWVPRTATASCRFFGLWRSTPLRVRGA
ncbi:MAG TPA: glycosyltransferase 87 family protein [Acidimicrobiia bacterium]|nr:glycosyltransferase 87 family protein [Acidimicrobiia bacterium]